MTPQQTRPPKRVAHNYNLEMSKQDYVAITSLAVEWNE